MYKIIFFSLVLLGITAVPAWAHDCWLQPDNFKIGFDMLLLARIFVGHQLKKDKELPLDKKITPRLDLFTREGKKDILPALVDGALPAVNFTPKFQGGGLLAMDRDFTTIILENEKFFSYVTHEHHTHLLDQIESNPRGRQKEEYARCMKAVVQVGGSPIEPELWSQTTGQKLEILLASPPKEREPVRVRVLFDGSPLAGKAVTVVNGSEDGLSDQTVTTNADGLAEFQNHQSGFWFIRLIHLYSCDDDDRDMDWTSYWASCCFEIQRR